MARFGLNIRELEDNIDNFKKYKDSALEDAITCYECLSNLDYAWMDNNSENFKDMINKDKFKLNEYFRYLDSFYNELETFKNNISDILSRYGCSRNSNINYSSSRIQECLNYLGYAIGYLNNAVQYIGDIVYPSDFVELDKVNELLNHLAWIRDDIDRYDDDICNLSNSILSELDDSRRRKSRISVPNHVFKEHIYNWSNVYMQDYKFSNDNKFDDKKMGKKAETASVNVSKNSKYSNIDVNKLNGRVSEPEISIDENKTYSEIDVKEKNGNIENVVLNTGENTKYSELGYETEGAYSKSAKIDINSNKTYSELENQEKGKEVVDSKFSVDDEELFSNISNNTTSKYEESITKINSDDIFKNVDNMSSNSDFIGEDSIVTIKDAPEFKAKSLTADEIVNNSEPVSVKTGGSILEDNKKLTSLDEIISNN